MWILDYIRAPQHPYNEISGKCSFVRVHNSIASNVQQQIHALIGSFHTSALIIVLIVPMSDPIVGLMKGRITVHINLTLNLTIVARKLQTCCVCMRGPRQSWMDVGIRRAKQKWTISYIILVLQLISLCNPHMETHGHLFARELFSFRPILDKDSTSSGKIRHTEQRFDKDPTIFYKYSSHSTNIRHILQFFDLFEKDSTLSTNIRYRFDKKCLHEFPSNILFGALWALGPHTKFGRLFQRPVSLPQQRLGQRILASLWQMPHL